MSKNSSSIEQPDRQQRRVLKCLAAIVSTVVLFFGSQLVGINIAVAILQIAGVEEADIPTLIRDKQAVQFLTLFIIQALLVASIYGLLRWRQVSVRKVLLPERAPRLSDLGVSIIAYGIYFLVLVSVTIVVSLLIPSFDVNQSQELGIVESDTLAHMLLVYGSIVILPAIAEEVLFRGFLFQYMKRFGGIILAYVLTSILFGMAHLEYENLNWVAMLDTTIFSVFLIYISQRQQSLWPAIFLHGIKNSIAFYVLFVH